MNVDLAKIMKEITEDILKGARDIMSSDIGINQKVGINTLSGSNLYNQIKWNFQQNDDNIVIDLFFNHYIEFIESGRMPKKGKRPPVFEIAKWLRRKHIVSSNENIMKVAYAVSYVIWRDGYKARKITEALDKYVDSNFDEKYADMIFDALFQEVDDYFSN